MALRNQPYLPLYVQDFLTDEKLNECSAASTGVYSKIMCIMHKSSPYGKILLKQKDKQTTKQMENFALKLVKHLPWTTTVIKKAIEELVDEDVLQLDGDALSQKRMIKDNDISLKRSTAGKSGVKMKKKFAKAKPQANTEIEIEDEIENNKIKWPFGNSVDFRMAWVEWESYKKDEFNFKYRSARSINAALNSLVKLSSSNWGVAMQIIDQSIANGWKGFFELAGSKETNPADTLKAIPENLSKIKDTASLQRFWKRLRENGYKRMESTTGQETWQKIKN